MWMATGGQAAKWWRERARVEVNLDTLVAVPVLTVTIKGDKPLNQAVTVLVNLPGVGRSLRLVAKDNNVKTPKIANIDTWRDAVVLQGLAPGTYYWQLYFDHTTTISAK